MENKKAPLRKVFLRFYSANNLGDDLFVKILSERYSNDFYMDTNNA
mgnify:CR=1 FL=1